MAVIPVAGGGTALQEAIDSAAAGSTLLIDDGVYSPVIINKNLTLSSINGMYNCIIDGNNEKRCITRTAGTVNLYGLMLQNGRTISGDGQSYSRNGGGSYGINSAFNCGWYNCYADNDNGGNYGEISLSGCYIDGCHADRYIGFGTSNGANRYWRNSIFKNCKSGKWGGVGMNCSLIENCVFEGNEPGADSSYVLHANNAAGGIVRNCIFRNNGRSAASTNYGIFIDHKVINCLFYDNYNICGLRGSGDLLNCTFGKNNFAGNLACYISRAANYQTTGISVCNNVFYDSRVLIQSTGSRNVYFQNNTIGKCYTINANVSGIHNIDNIDGENSTFRLTDGKENDYRLRRGSIGIDNGDDACLMYSTDLDGRPFKDPPSIGTYQYSIPGTMPMKMNPFAVGEDSKPIYDAELEYLDSLVVTNTNVNGTGDIGANVIDTGIVPNGGTSFEVKAAEPTASDVSAYLLEYPSLQYTGECRNGIDQISDGTNRTQYGFHLTTTGWGRVIAFGVNCDTYYNINPGILTFSYDAQHRIVKSVRASTAEVLTASVPLSAIEGNTYTNNFTLFCRWVNADRTNTQCRTQRLYYAKFWQDGELVRDYIPVRVGQTAFLYEKISKKLLGTGRFKAGPDIPTAYDSEIEYVQSTGAQWINTDILISDCKAIAMDIDFTENIANMEFFGSQAQSATSGSTSDKKRLFGIVTVSNSVITEGYIDFGEVTNSRIMLASIASGTRITLPKTQINVSNTGAIPGKIIPFFRSTYTNGVIHGTGGHLKLYYLKMWNSEDELIADFIPVRCSQRGYLYDRISGKFFGDAGGTNFILGPDVQS